MSRKAKIVLAIIGIALVLLIAILSQLTKPPTPGTLMFVYDDITSLSGMVVTINKLPQSGQNIYDKQLASGEYTVNVSKPGYKTISQKVDIISDETTLMNVNLELATKPSANDLSQIFTQEISGSAPTLLSTELPASTIVVGTQYFDNQTWAIVTINIIGSSGIAYFVDQYNPSTNSWALVTTPDDDFTADEIQSMPPDVQQYINSHYYVSDD